MLTHPGTAEQTGDSSRIWVRMLDQPDGKPIFR